MQPSLRNRASTNLFLFFDRLGLHVLPKHFYTPVADYDWLRKNRDAWEPAWDMRGVHWNLDEQLSWVKDVCSDYVAEVAGLEFYKSLEAEGLGLGYGPIESQVLHAFIRKFTPRRIVEVGSGVSTGCALHAVWRNEAEEKGPSEIVCIEPFPKRQFANVREVTHVQSFVQTVDRRVFDQLGPGDLLFIDSSHAVKTGSDVTMLFLEVLPKLRSGVYVHIHDIFFPYLYAPNVLKSVFGWQETTLLAALLSGNSRLRVRASLSGLHYGRQRELMALLPDYRPQTLQSGVWGPSEDTDLHFPSSIYLEVL